jgi:hypothetical protein
MRAKSFLPVLSAALLFLSAFLLRRVTGMDWTDFWPAAVFATSPLAAAIAMAATRTVPYSTGPLLTAGLALSVALFFAVILFGGRGQVVSVLMNPILIFSMLGMFPQGRWGWCSSDRGLLVGSATIAAVLLGAAALIG